MQSAYEWDADKNARNIAKHGLPLVLAAAVLVDPAALTSVDRRRDYGEPRLITYGAVAGRVFVAVHTFRQEAHRLISVRKANEQEAQRYREGRAPA